MQKALRSFIAGDMLETPVVTPTEDLSIQILTKHAHVQIAPMEVGRINIQYRRTECTPPEPLNIDINHNYGPGAWLRIVVSVRPP